MSLVRPKIGPLMVTGGCAVGAWEGVSRERVHPPPKIIHDPPQKSEMTQVFGLSGEGKERGGER